MKTPIVCSVLYASADDLEIQIETCNDDSNLEMDKCTHESLLYYY